MSTCHSRFLGVPHMAVSDPIAAYRGDSAVNFSGPQECTLLTTNKLTPERDNQKLTASISWIRKECGLGIATGRTQRFDNPYIAYPYTRTLTLYPHVAYPYTHTWPTHTPIHFFPTPNMTYPYTHTHIPREPVSSKCSKFQPGVLF